MRTRFDEHRVVMPGTQHGVDQVEQFRCPVDNGDLLHSWSISLDYQTQLQESCHSNRRENAAKSSMNDASHVSASYTRVLARQEHRENRPTIGACRISSGSCWRSSAKIRRAKACSTHPSAWRRPSSS